MSEGTSTAGPLSIPIYYNTVQSPQLVIYASLGGGPVEPYSFDTGAPNLFATYGSWWPGTTEATEQGADSFTFAQAPTYYYNPVATTVTLSDVAGDSLATATNVNVAQVTNIDSNTPAESYTAWANAVASGGTPLANGTFGDFGAGLYGTSTLGTVLAQLPEAPGLMPGFIVEAPTSAAAPGTLAVGLNPATIAAWKANPATLILTMAPTGAGDLPNPDGNAAWSIFSKAQASDTQVAIITNAGTYTTPIPTVIDTDGGPNNNIYDPGTLDLPSWLSYGTLPDGTRYQLTQPAGETAGGTLLSYVTGSGVLPAGGNTNLLTTPADDGLRDNPGFNLFLTYDVMFDVADDEVLLQPIACFAAGTRIATEDGWREIEQLQVGDLVRTQGGEVLPVTWLGSRRADCRRHPAPAAVQPIRIAPHSFGPGLPERPLLLSPDHAVFIEDVLIPVKHLATGALVRQQDVASVTYHHVELPHHAVILAEGLPVESYLDTGDRMNFAGKETRLHPVWGSTAGDVALIFDALGAAPLRVTGPELERARVRLAASEREQVRRFVQG
ncbi:Hint domain-containing protein [Acidisoma sp. 7E03]